MRRLGVTFLLVLILLSLVSARTNWPRLRSRQLQDRRSVLVVRMKAPGETVQQTESHERDLDNLLYNNEVSVRSQMQLCSNWQVVLQPTSPSMLSLDVDPPLDANNRTLWKENAASTILDHFDIKANDVISRLRTLADHVVLILPVTYPDSKFVAEAEVGKSISVFSYSWSKSLPTFLHEFGHNMGLRHARLKDDQYGDITGYMGHSWASVQQKCYNAANHWQLNWFQNQRVSLLESSPELIELIPFVDSSEYATKTVLVQLDESRYLQLNGAKKHNQDTNIYKNKIVVIEDDGNQTRVVAGLAASDTYTSGEISVVVCDIVTDRPSQYDHATLSFTGVCPERPDCQNCENQPKEQPEEDEPPRHDAPFDFSKDSSNDAWDTMRNSTDIASNDSKPGWVMPTMTTLGTLGALSLIAMLLFCRARRKVEPNEEEPDVEREPEPAPSILKSFSETVFGEPKNDVEPFDPYSILKTIQERINDCHCFH